MLLFVPIAGAASNAGDIRKADLFEAPENSTADNDLFTELSEKPDFTTRISIKFPQFSKSLWPVKKFPEKLNLITAKCFT